MLRFFSKRKAERDRPWVYLGWTEIKYINGEETTSAITIHFYARGDDLDERKFEYVGKGKYDIWQYHPYVQQNVIPWSHGNNKWGPIAHPSEEFQEWTKEHCRYEWKGGKWFLPAEKVEGNVVTFPKKAATEAS